MPIFEYTCLECGKEFERLVMKASEDGSIKCPVCQSTLVEKKISGFASFSDSVGAGSSDCSPGGG